MNVSRLALTIATAILACCLTSTASADNLPITGQWIGGPTTINGSWSKSTNSVTLDVQFPVANSKMPVWLTAYDKNAYNITKARDYNEITTDATGHYTGTLPLSRSITKYRGITHALTAMVVQWNRYCYETARSCWISMSEKDGKTVNGALYDPAVSNPKVKKAKCKKNSRVKACRS